jgi:hypothetical protein
MFLIFHQPLKLRISRSGKDLDIKPKKGKLTLDKIEEIYEIRLYPCRFEEKELIS